MSILVKICKNLYLVKFFRKYRFWRKLSKNLKFGQICRKISIFDKIVENSRFGSKFSKNLHFGQNCRKFSILVKTYQNVEFGQNCRKYWLKSKFFKNFRQMSVWVEIHKYIDFGQSCRKISILVNIYENLDFCQNLWKSRFWSKLSENIFGKSRFFQNFQIFSGKIDFGQNFRF